MSYKTFAGILAFAAGAAITVAGVNAYRVLSKPAPLKTYTLIFASGESTQIGAEGYRAEGGCVIFTRPYKVLAICNEPLTVLYDENPKEAEPPAKKEEAPVGPSKLEPNGNLQAGN